MKTGFKTSLLSPVTAIHTFDSFANFDYNNNQLNYPPDPGDFPLNITSLQKAKKKRIYILGFFVVV